MSRPSRILIALGLCCLLGGCFLNTNQARVTSDYAANVKTVGIISLLNTNPKINYLSTSAMDSRFSSAVVKGWNSDNLVYALLVPRMQRKGYTVRTLSRSGALAEAQASDWRSPLGNSVADAVYAAGEARGLDMVVVVQAQVREDFVTDTNQKVRAFGLQKAFDTEAFVYASIFVEAYDIKRRFAVGRAEGNQVEPADAGLWNSAFETHKGEVALSGGHGQALADQLTRVLTNAIGVATQEAGL